MIDKIRKFFTLENKIVALVTFAAIFFAQFPTLYNWLNTPVGFWFPKQTSWYDAWDINVYVSYIRYGQRVGVMLQNTYTTLPHPGVFIYQYYTFLGVLNRLLHLDPFILFHLASIITSIFLIITCYYVTKVFIKDFALRIGVFIVIVLGGGFGWIPYLFNSSGDTTAAGFTLVNALERGHDALITLLLILSVTFIFRYIKTWQNKYFYLSLATSFLSYILQPALLLFYISIGGITFLWFGLKEKKWTLWKYLISLLILSILYLIFVLIDAIGSPGFVGFFQNPGMNSLSPFLGFGLISFLVIWALLITNDSSEEFIFLKIFFLTQFFLMFLPVGFPRYFIKGLHIGGVLLAFYILSDLFKNKNTQIKVIVILVVTSLITRIYIFDTLMHPKTSNAFFFLTLNEGNMLSSLDKLPPSSGVLSLFRIGNYIPAFTDNKVYYGYHLSDNIGENRLLLAQSFYTSMNEESQREFIKNNRINYIYYGLEESALRKQKNLSTDNPFPYFPVIYKNDAATLYSIGTLPSSNP